LDVIDEKAITVTGKLSCQYKNARVLNTDVIRPLKNPYSQQGGIAILRAQPCAGRSVVKQSAVAPAMQKNEGKAARPLIAKMTLLPQLWLAELKAATLWFRYEGPKAGRA